MNPEIELYIFRFPKEIQERLLRVREIFLEEAPGADEAIKYQMPTIVRDGNLIHYAAFKNHIGVYPLPHVLAELKEEIKGYVSGKGSIRFSNEEPLPEDLIRKIVRKRIEEKEKESTKKNDKNRKP